MTDGSVSYCEGCSSYWNGSDTCNLSYNNKGEGTCPCTECIIKIMCSDPCEVYIEYNTKKCEDRKND